MKYYRLNHNGLNIKETGTQFQSLSGIAGDIQKDFIPQEGRIDFNFVMPEPFMEVKAKQTTYLYAMILPSQFFIFKDYFITFLKNFNLDENQDWSIKVHHKNQIITDYKMFYLNNELQDKIVDFKNSTFKYMNNLELVGFKKFNNSTELVTDLKKEIFNQKMLYCDELVLDFSKIKFDMIRLSKVPLINGIFISDKLKNEIEKQSFTGFSFQDIEEIDKRIKVTY